MLPRRWDELEIDFEDESVRYSRLCEKKVCKVSNLFNYNQNKDTYEFLAIPIGCVVFRTLSDEIKNPISLYTFVQISRRLIQQSGYDESIDFNSCEAIDTIKDTLSFLIEKHGVSYDFLVLFYEKYYIELDTLLSDINAYFQDEELYALSEKLKN